MDGRRNPGKKSSASFVEVRLLFIIVVCVISAWMFPAFLRADGGAGPSLTKMSGDAQVVAVSSFTSAPLVVQVTDSSSSPMANTEVTFAVGSGSDGSLSSTSGGTTSTNIGVMTDENGNASVYYVAGSDVLRNSIVTASVGTGTNAVVVSFTSHCGFQNGLISWLAGDSGITADTSGNVSYWQDQSPNTNSAVQPTSSMQPQIVTGDLAGHSVVRFNGSSTCLAMPACIADDFTMIVIFRSALGAGTGGQWYNAAGIVDAKASGTANDFGMSLDGTGELLTGVGNPNTSIVSLIGGYNDNRGHIATFTRTEASGAFSQFLDSALQGTQTGTTASLTGSSEIMIGATQTLANYFGGDVAEVLLYNRNLTSNEQNAIEGFLADKYGIYSPNATWPQSYATDIQSLIAENRWSKAQVDAYLASPSAPTQPTASSGAPGTVYLGWANGSGATSTIIEEQNSDGSWSIITTINDPTISSYAVTGLTSGQNYDFRIIASNAEGTATASVSYSAGSNLPIMTKVGGDKQIISSSTFAANPIVVQVNDASGNALSNVPVTFALASGSDGSFAITSGGTAADAQVVGTNAQGQAEVFYESGTDVLRTNQVVVSTPSTTGNISADFSEFCGMQAGMSLWLSSNSGITADSSGNVSQWHDQSPGDNNAAGSTGSEPQIVSNLLGGKPALTFDGSTQYLTIPDSASLKPSQITIMAVYQQKGGENDQRIVCKPYWSGTWSNPYLAYALDAVFWSNYNPGFEVSSYANDNRLFSSQAAQTSSPQILTGIYDGSSEKLYVASSDPDSIGVSGTVDYGDESAKSLFIGMNGNGGEYFNGNLSEVLIWGRALSDDERQSAEGYLADKYGLYDPNATWPLSYSTDVQALITANHWSKTQADAYVALVATNPPVPPLGLVTWLKADEGVTADESGNVSQWADQGPNSYMATSLTGSQPSLAANAYNGKPAIRFDGSSQFLTLSPMKDAYSAGMTSFAVFNPTSNSSWSRIYDFGNGPGINNLILSRYGTTSQLIFQAYQGNSAGVSIASNNDLLQSQLQQYTVVDDPTSQAQMLKFGNVTASATGYAPDSVTRASSFIGKSNWGDPLYQGDIAEILIYNRALSVDERAQVNGYLADKYGIYDPNATWTLAYSSDVQAQIIANDWNKNQADAYVTFLNEYPGLPASGLVLWLKTDAGLSQSNGNVVSWADQSTYQNNALPGAVPPTVSPNGLAGHAAVHFDGSGSTYLAVQDSASLRPNTYTLLAVAQEDSTGSGQYLLSRPYYAGGAYGGWTWPFMSYAMLMDCDNATYLRSFVTPAGSTYIYTPQANTYPISQPNEFVWRYDGSNQDVYCNGNMTPSASVSTSGNIDYGGGAANLTIGVHSSTDLRLGQNEALDGEVYEILLYNRALSDTEMQQAQGYLADKYGLYNPNATWPLAYSSDVQALIVSNQWTKIQADGYVAFIATNPPLPSSGLSLWLKSDSGITSDSDGNVSTWVDQSPFGHNAQQTNSSIRPAVLAASTGGLPAVHFTGSQYLNIADSTSLHGSTQTVFAVAHENSTQTYQTIFARGYYNSSNWPYPYVSFSDCLFGVNGGNYLRSVVTTAGNITEANGANSYDLASSHVFSWLYDGSNQQIFLSGSLATETATSGGIDYSGGTSDYVIGSRSSTSPGEFLDADVSELIVYNRALNDIERIQVEQYLADKYGLPDPDATWPQAYSTAVQSEIVQNQWNKAQADAYVAFQAANSSMLTNGLMVWLKADEGVTQDGNGNVTSWIDQAENNVFSQTDLGYAPTFVANDSNGKPALRLNGNDWMHNPNSLGTGVNGEMTMIAVATTSNPGTQEYSFWMGATGTGLNRGIGYYQSHQILDSYNIFGEGGGAPPVNTFVAEEWSLSPDRSTGTLYQNGVQTAVVNLSGVQDIQPGLSVGTLFSEGGNWQGDIAEILVYNHQLSASELAQVDGYLADKYGYYDVNATWFSGYSSAVQSQIIANNWNKAQADAYASFLATNPPVPADGLEMWLEADSGVTADSNGKVSSWSDQTVYGNNANQLNSANQPVLQADCPDLNGKSALHFDGSSSFLDVTDNGTLQPANAVTVIAAVQTNSAQAQDFVDRPLSYNFYGYWALAPFYSYELGMNANDVNRGYVAVNGGSDLSTSNSGPTQMSINTMVYNGTNQAIYTAGTLRASVAASGSIDYGEASHDILIGAGSTFRGLDNYLNGNVAEVLIYNRALTSSEQQQAEVYLADKYGLYHPSATWPLAYSTAIQAQIGSNQWNKGQADAYVALQAATPSLPIGPLCLWLRGDLGVTADSNGKVSQWTDQSIFGNNANQSNSGNEPTLIGSRADLNGEPVIRFDGTSSYLDVTDSQTLKPSGSLTVIAAVQAYGSQQQDVLAHALPYNFYGYYPLAPFYSYDLGFNPNYFEHSYLGAASGTDLTSSSAVSSQMAVTSLVYDGSNENLYSGGSLQSATPVSGAIDYDGNNQHDLLVGAGQNFRGLLNYLDGDVAEVMVFNRALTDTERQEVEIYLSDKYGLYNPGATWLLAYSTDVQVQIGANQWNKSQADAYVALQAANPNMLTTGLVMWLKADSGVATDGSGNVTGWTDQSGNFNMTQGSPGNEPTYVTDDVNGNPALRFSGNQWLSNPNNMGASIDSDLTIIEVGSTANPSNHEYAVWLGGTGNGTGRSLGYNANSPLFDTQSISYSAGSAPGANVFALQMGVMYPGVSAVSLYENGVNVGTGGIGGVQNVTPGVTVGASAGQIYGWQGDIAEVLVYNHQLNFAELQEVNLYLANKYNIPISLPGPQISPVSGSYGNGQTVTISMPALTGATIHYTTDGSSPTGSSTAYTVPFTLSADAVVNAAIFWSDGSEIGPVAIAQYAINGSTPPGTPPLPAGLSVTADSSGQGLDLSWSIGTGVYDSVNIYRSDNGGAYNLIATLDAGSTSYVDQNVVAGVSYQYEVGTINESGSTQSAATVATEPAGTSPITISITSPSNAVALP